MKKTAFFLSIVTLLMGFSIKSSAQGYYFYDDDYYDTDWMYELGGSVGIINCLTDLGGKKGNGKPFLKDYNFGNNQLGGGVFLSALYKNQVAIRLEGTFGQVKAYDSILSPIRDNSGARYYRGLHFRSKISEVSLMVELHPRYLFVDWASKDREPPRLSPYILAGIGYFHFNPQARSAKTGKWVDLQPLRTEGQGFDEYPGRKVYKLSQINFPIGLGVKYELSRTFNLRAEVVPRILRTDYLDDVSTRYANPNLADEHPEYYTGEKAMYFKELNDRRLEVPGFPFTINPKGGQLRGDAKDKDAFFTVNIKLGITFGREKE